MTASQTLPILADVDQRALDRLAEHATNPDVPQPLREYAARKLRELELRICDDTPPPDEVVAPRTDWCRPMRTLSTAQRLPGRTE